jgi:hypothetical protein
VVSVLDRPAISGTQPIVHDHDLYAVASSSSSERPT